jgi:hypothetical protein
LSAASRAGAERDRRHFLRAASAAAWQSSRSYSLTPHRCSHPTLRRRG